MKEDLKVVDELEVENFSKKLSRFKTMAAAGQTLVGVGSVSMLNRGLDLGIGYTSEEGGLYYLLAGFGAFMVGSCMAVAGKDEGDLVIGDAKKRGLEQQGRFFRRIKKVNYQLPLAID